VRAHLFSTSRCEQSAFGVGAYDAIDRKPFTLLETADCVARRRIRDTMNRQL
jgi:hypothetical protein